MRFRIPLVIAAALSLGLLVALMAAGATWNTPVLPERQQVLPLAEMQLTGSRQVEGPGDARWLEGADETGRSLLLRRGLALEASDWRYLRLRMERFPAHLRAALVWRSSDSPERMQTLVLARPARRASLSLLEGAEGWSGTVSEIGLLVFPANLVDPQAARDRRYAVSEIGLESESLRGALASVLSEWTAYRPWVGRSINTAGFEVISPRTYTLVWLVAVATLLMAVALILALRLRGARLGTAFAVSVLAAWLLLDLHQLAQLFWRTGFMREAHLRSDQVEVDVRLNAALSSLRPQLEAAGIRLALVGASLPFHRTYGAFRLLPLPSVAIDAPPQLEHAGDSLALVLVGKGDWSHDAASGLLDWGDRRYAVELLHQDDQLAAFRLRARVNGEVSQ